MKQWCYEKFTFSKW